MARGLSLKKLSDLRRFVAKIANQVYAGEIDTDRARALAYLSNVLRDIIKDSDLENRISELEERMSTNDKNHEGKRK